MTDAEHPQGPELAGTTEPNAFPPARRIAGTFKEQTDNYIESLTLRIAQLDIALLRERSELSSEQRKFQELMERLGVSERDLAAKRQECLGLIAQIGSLNREIDSTRFRGAVVGIGCAFMVAIGGGLISYTTAVWQTVWVIVLVVGAAVLLLFSLLTFTDDLRASVVSRGVVGTIRRLCCGPRTVKNREE